jgi:iron complex transport system substrate-binding protein
MPDRRRFMVLAAACFLVCADPARAEPIEIRDALGRTIVLPQPPQRIVPIFASNTELIAALGLTDRIVGIEAFTHYPPEVLARPLVGGRLGFSVDAIVALRPDLVVVTPAREAADQLIDPMQRLGVPTIVLLQRTVAEIIANVRLLGRATGIPERGEQVAAGLETRLVGIAHQVQDLAKPRVIMITGRVGDGLVLVAKPNTYTGDAIVLAGGRFALEARALASVSPEAIFDADPDVLLFAGSEKDRDELLNRPGWGEMRAVQTKHVYGVSRSELLIPGPRVIDGIEHLAAVLHSPGLTQ